MTVYPIKQPISGSIQVPPDKSISHRALILGAIAYGNTKIHNLLLSEDVMATINCLRQLGVEISMGNPVIVHGKGLYGLSASKEPLCCGNSGTTMRLLAGILAAQPFTTILTGDKSLQTRPMQRIISPLTLMGASINSNDGKAPLVICGSVLKPITYHIPVQSAQVKSAIQLAGLYVAFPSIITGAHMVRNHTEVMLKHMQKDNKLYAAEINIPGDISSAAFFMVLGLLHADEGIAITKVGLNPTRTAIITALKAMGGDVQVVSQSVQSGEVVGDVVVKKSSLKPLQITKATAAMLIDEIPILAVAAAFADGTSTFTGLAELRTKETDRIHTISTELSKLGIDIKPTFDGMIITGKKPIDIAKLDSHGDHRIAMAAAIAATMASEPITIENADCVNISYPNFFKDMERFVQLSK